MKHLILTPLLLLISTLAQPVRPASSAILKSRESLMWRPAQLYFTAWQNPDCDGASVLNGDVQYDAPNTILETWAMQSYSLNRTLEDGEQLDFSASVGVQIFTLTPPNSISRRQIDLDNAGRRSCAQYLSTAKGGGAMAGCHNVAGGANCYRLWRY